MRSLMGSITGFAGTEAVGLARPAQCDLTLAAQAEFIICNQSIDEVFLTINGERHYPYSDTSRTYASSTRIYGYLQGCFPSSLATANPRFYVGKFGQRTKVTL
jgi:hypothetical protein